MIGVREGIVIDEERIAAYDSEITIQNRSHDEMKK
jgi:hypothetical protein